jgi:Ca-activated chloride channel family protein
LWLIPVLIVFFVAVFRSKRRALQRFGSIDLVQKLIRNTSKKRQIVKIGCLLTAIVFMVLALSRPQLGTRLEEVKREGIDVIVALDLSLSMMAQDVQPSRLEKAKHEVESFINLLEGDRIGLVAFAGLAHLQCPLTLDYGAAKMFLNIMDPDLIPRPGTRLGLAIEKALEGFEAQERKHKVLILITDGEDHEGDALEVAKEAERQGVVIYTVGIGSPRGEPIPVSGQTQRAEFKKNRDGEVVITKLDEVTLEKIALQTGGKYYRASSGEQELKSIYADIAGMEKKELGSLKFSQFEDRYQILIALAIVLLVSEVLIGERKRIRREWRGRFM